jgi:hypothetical protein
VVVFKTISGLAPGQYDLVADFHALAGRQRGGVFAVAHEVGLTLGGRRSPHAAAHPRLNRILGDAAAPAISVANGRDQSGKHMLALSSSQFDLQRNQRRILTNHWSPTSIYEHAE